MDIPEHIVILVVALVVGTLLVDALVFYFIIRFIRKRRGPGGWQRLSQLYPTGGAVLVGPNLAKQTLVVGMVRYKRMVTVVAGDSGLGLKRKAILPWGSPPAEILIPWEDIVGWTAPKGFWDWGYSLQLAKGMGMVVSPRTFEAMKTRLHPNEPISGQE